ncbi:MAG TPA: TIR domain-containing protein [Sphingomonas sp.]|jgi:hypothetical protein|uniref:TIR domain-containing protein n=1 Tax=Sphingomonas sp. TaxID=28214 RepID=UPI002EDB78D2
MARRTFFSFHYGPDVWRAWNVRNSWVVTDAEAPQGFFDNSVFEAKKRESDASLKRFLRDGLYNTSVTCVLNGAQTATRRWVRYEIARSVIRGNGLLTVDVHGVKNSRGITTVRGTDPLSQVGVYRAGSAIHLAEVVDGRWVKYADYTLAIPARDLWFTPPVSSTVVPISKRCMRYDFVAQRGRENIGGWIEMAAGLAGR